MVIKNKAKPWVEKDIAAFLRVEKKHSQIYQYFQNSSPIKNKRRKFIDSYESNGGAFQKAIELYNFFLSKRAFKNRAKVGASKAKFYWNN